MLAQEIRARIKLFYNQPYALFALSGIFATFGNGLIYIALSWISYKEFNSISGTALMMFCIWMPSILLGPFFGVCADRYNRKFLLILSNLVRGISVVSFVIASTYNLHVNIFALAVILGFFVSFYMPAAIPFLSSILEKEQLVIANATIDMLYELGTIIGMGISGLLILYFGIYGTLCIGGIFFLISGVINYLMKDNAVENNHVTIVENKNSFLKDYLLSLIYLKGNRHLLSIYSIQMLVMVLLMTIPVLLVPYTKEILNLGTTQFAIFEGLFSAGVFLGGLFSPIICRISNLRSTLLILLSLMSVNLYIFSSNINLTISYISYFLIGFCLSSWGLSISQAQLHTETDFQGRLQSTFNSLGGIFILLIYLLIMMQGGNLPIKEMYELESVCAVLAVVVTYFAPVKLLTE